MERPKKGLTSGRCVWHHNGGLRCRRKFVLYHDGAILATWDVLLAFPSRSGSRGDHRVRKLTLLLVQVLSNDLPVLSPRESILDCNILFPIVRAQPGCQPAGEQAI